MKNLEYREFYRRNLPHIQPRGMTFLVNFRLAGSLPSDVIQRLKTETDELEVKLSRVENIHERYKIKEEAQRKLFEKWDDALHKNKTDPFWLKDDTVAEIVSNSINYHNGKWFDIEAYCIMPNHLHLVLTPYKSSDTDDYSLSKIMHNIKRNSANHANKYLERTGSFWQHENYDHFMRNEAELERIIKYVLYNPVKAGLVQEQKDWKWTYCKYDF